MNVIQISILSAGFFLLILATGFWVKRLGKPYPTLVLNIHKLIALGAVVYLAITAARISKADPLTTAQVASLVLSAVLFVGTIVSGGLASIDKPMAVIPLKIHRVSPYLTLLAGAASLYFLLV